MKKITIFSIITLLISTESGFSNNSDLTKIYNGKEFSVQYPSDYEVDSGYIEATYFSSGRKINGVAIHKILGKSDQGSNLAKAIISLEADELPANKKCNALLVNPVVSLEVINPDEPRKPKSTKDGNLSYSTFSIGDAGMSQWLSEDIWAIENSNPCVIIRYITYGVAVGISNEVTKHYDEKSLHQTFDEIRRSIKLNQGN